MNLYLVKRTDENVDYDEYISFVVVAENEAVARATHPSPWRGEALFDETSTCWSVTKDSLEVTLIGRAVGTIRGIVCSSFNAG